MPNVIVTGHQGFLTHEAMHEICAITISNFDEIEAGVKLHNAVAR